jgi:prepilin-type processing-associated H-X9-DG protein
VPRRRKNKAASPLHHLGGPLPARFGDRFAGQLLVFCDASRKRHGGLAAVLFFDGETVSVSASCTVPATGSNELELQANLFGLQQAERHFPGRPLAVFTDNQDAATRLNRASELGLAQDPALATMLHGLDLAGILAHASIHWVKGHSTCRGNVLADELAGAAAG